MLHKDYEVRRFLRNLNAPFLAKKYGGDYSITVSDMTFRPTDCIRTSVGVDLEWTECRPPSVCGTPLLDADWRSFVALNVQAIGRPLLSIRHVI